MPAFYQDELDTFINDGKIQIRPILFSTKADNYTFIIPNNINDIKTEKSKGDKEKNPPIGSIIIEVANLQIDRIAGIMTYENIKKNIKDECSDKEFLLYLYKEFSKVVTDHMALLLLTELLSEYNNELPSYKHGLIRFSLKRINPIKDILVAYQTIARSFITNRPSSINDKSIVLKTYSRIENNEFKILHSVNAIEFINPLISVFEFDMMQSFSRNIKFTQCLCGKYFKVMHNQKVYCDACGKSGAAKVAHNKEVKNHPILHLYKKAADKARMRKVDFLGNKDLKRIYMTEANYYQAIQELVDLKSDYIHRYDNTPSVELASEFDCKVEEILMLYTNTSK